MSDIMRPIPFGKLMDWLLSEYADHGSMFGVAKLAKHTNGQARPIFGEKIEAPFGPAAGPNTQLAQNIIASYAGGSRFFELKTVQIMDGEELSKCVSKPCITAGDECYNCEWSTELTVPQAYEEYVKAWFALKLIAKAFGLGDPDGFVFNMSVGYDLAGIKSEKIDAYIEGMKDASGSAVWKECTDWALANVERLANVDEAYIRAISPRVSRSITESTLHGCPPDEIERIATYLITEKGLNTYVKCNPTLLGYDFARKTLDGLGYDYVAFDDHHFVEDLQWADAVPMFRRLTALAEERGLEFGVKLTNTFPVDVKAGELPSEEMYMSGRSLFPLTISLAKKISAEFDGKLRISYSGGADIHSMSKLVSAGIWPVTIATYLLKPGGYERQYQLAQELMEGGNAPFNGVDAAAVAKLADEAMNDPWYRKPVKPLPGRKNGKKVPLLDCFTAPCRGGCPIGQDIPAYLRLAGEGKYEEALEVITRRNPLPFITGTICAHRCMDRCARNFYDESVEIRAVKLVSAIRGFGTLLPKLKAKPAVDGRKAAVIGGGPAGLAAAFFLAREGVDVTIFEATGKLGGVVRHIIPEFRIDSYAIDNDIALVKAMGVKVELNSYVESIDALKAQGFTHVILAVGAQKAGDPGLEYGECVNFTEVLAAAKNGAAPKLGANVVVIGGGNSAMDTARAAKRIPGVEKVRLVYRRTKRYMPADEEELAEALADGVEFCELLAPVGVRDGVLTCKVMKLGAPDASGRRAPEETGEIAAILADTVIAAVGERVDADFFAACGIAVDGRGKAIVDEATMETNVSGVYVAGDARRGPATVVEAIADATRAAQAIVDFSNEDYAAMNAETDCAAVRAKKGIVCDSGCDRSESERCLECAAVCETCVSVCPNRANVAVAVEGMAARQIVHVDGMCNECGNCAVFCPYDSRPYKDKFTLFWSEEDFRNSENEGFLRLENGTYRVRLDGQVEDVDLSAGCTLPDGIRRLIAAVEKDYSYLLV